MTVEKQQRTRGICLSPLGWTKLKAAKAQLEIANNCGNRYTFEALSEYSQLDQRTVARILTKREGVDKRSLEQFFRAFNLKLEKDDYIRAVKEESSHTHVSHTQTDWGEVINVEVFVGRTDELVMLKQWIVSERCRLITILGMGGIGKTTLTVKLAQKVHGHFEYLIWRSLRNAPSPREIVWQLIQFLSTEEVELPDSLVSGMDQLLNCLRRSRCLVVLDNIESILCSKEYAGSCSSECKGYEEMFRRLGQESHNSCVLLTSREQPTEVALLEQADGAVRSFVLGGLEPEAAQALCQSQGTFIAQPRQWQIAIAYYRGNPLALRIVAASIRDYLGGDVAAFLDYVEQGGLVFGEIQDLLARQFQRLTDLEQQVMYWLAVHREPVSLQQLQGNLKELVRANELLSAVQSLGRRSLIEICRDLKFRVSTFTLQPMVMEYVTNQLIAGIVQEIVTQQHTDVKMYLLPSVALLIAQGKDDIKEAQRLVILTPIVEKLLAYLGSEKAIALRLQQMITHQQQRTPQKRGYKAGNILNLRNFSRD